MSKKYGYFLVLYGSQTGQSKAISEILVYRTQKLGLNPEIFELNEIGKKFELEHEPLIVIICSSTGNGDPPDNAVRFVKWISRRDHPLHLLKETTFALLGLGDSNYSSFQEVPRKLEKNLLRLGAQHLVETGVADDQAGLELAVEPWLDKVVSKLTDWFSLSAENLEKLSVEDSDGHTSEKNLQLSKPSRTMAETEGMNFEEEEEEEPQECVLKVAKVSWPNDTPCLVKGSEERYREGELRVPILATTYLASRVTHEKFNEVLWQNGCPIVGAASEILNARVVGTIELTTPKAAKMKREIHIDVGSAIERLYYEPGDAFYFTFPNPREEVNFILQRMNLLPLSDQKCVVCVHPKTEKPNATLPSYIPEMSSLRYIFTHCLDIRRSPSRPLLRCLAEHTTDEGEKNRLLQLCSAQGVGEFTDFVRKAGISLVDLLLAFPSCRPQADRLMELLPRLQPRAYSVACSQMRWKSRIRFIYSLLEFPVGEGRQYPRYGLSSGWLSSLRLGDQIKVFLKEPARFRLPPPALKNVDPREIPLILIGPGTGLAPFLSFLQHIYYLDLSKGKKCGVERELYFGCRCLEIDCICRDEMEFYSRENVLSYLEICESQSKNGQKNERVKYVQDALSRRGEKVVEMLTRTVSEGSEPSRVYVCGDAKGMSKGVWATFISLLMKHKGKTEEEAKRFMEELKQNDRYLEDVWA